MCSRLRVAVVAGNVVVGAEGCVRCVKTVVVVLQCVVCVVRRVQCMRARRWCGVVAAVQVCVVVCVRGGVWWW